MNISFPPWSSTLARAVVFGGPFVLAGLLVAPMVVVRTPYFQGKEQPILQPVQFDHRHHVADDHIDCRFCHQTVETGSQAGYPSTSTCLGCHAQVWNASPLLDVVRRSDATGESIRWRRVHQLPQYVYFDHSIHVNRGVGCETCHGRVDQMPQVEQRAPLTMRWCLDCHRDPTPHLRPPEQVTAMGWTAPADFDPKELARRLDLHTRVACTTCHR